MSHLDEPAAGPPAGASAADPPLTASGRQLPPLSLSPRAADPAVPVCAGAASKKPLTSPPAAASSAPDETPQSVLPRDLPQALPSAETPLIEVSRVLQSLTDADQGSRLAAEETPGQVGRRRPFPGRRSPDRGSRSPSRTPQEPRSPRLRGGGSFDSTGSPTQHLERRGTGPGGLGGGTPERRISGRSPVLTLDTSTVNEFLRRFVPQQVLLDFVREGEEIDVDRTAPIISNVTAAVGFFDVSGFSKLSDRLQTSEHSKTSRSRATFSSRSTASSNARGADVGAASEDLNAFLNSALGEVVDKIVVRGGDVIKFAGDAVIVMWAAERLLQSPALCLWRALSCAQVCLNMSNSDGEMLGLHVGLSLGPVSLIHVGGVQGRWETTVLGLPAIQAFDACDASGEGQIILHENARKALSPPPKSHWIVDLEEHSSASGLWLLNELRCELPSCPALTRPPPAVPLELLQQYVPEPLIPMAGTEESGSLRKVTVLFIKLADITKSQLVSTSQERLVRSLHSRLQRIQDVILRCGATLRQFIVDDKGCVVIAALGLPPFFHEDNATRGVNIATALCEQYPVSVGVTTGEAFCGIIGSKTRSEYSIVGDCVNFSARLMGKAGVQEFVMDARTRLGCGKVAGTVTAEFTKVKGKPAPVEVFRVRPQGVSSSLGGGEGEGATTGSDDSELVVGRQQQLEDLRLACAEGRELGAVVVIEGGKGAGKSLLMSQVDQFSSPSHVHLLGVGEENESGTRYFAWKNILSVLLELRLDFSKATPPTPHARRQAKPTVAKASTPKGSSTAPPTSPVSALAGSSSQPQRKRRLSNFMGLLNRRGSMSQSSRSNRSAKPSMSEKWSHRSRSARDDAPTAAYSSVASDGGVQVPPQQLLKISAKPLKLSEASPVFRALTPNTKSRVTSLTAAAAGAGAGAGAAGAGPPGVTRSSYTPRTMARLASLQAAEGTDTSGVSWSVRANARVQVGTRSLLASAAAKQQARTLNVPTTTKGVNVSELRSRLFNGRRVVASKNSDLIRYLLKTHSLTEDDVQILSVIVPMRMGRKAKAAVAIAPRPQDVARVLSVLLKTLLSVAPASLVIDDVHFLDESSWILLSSLADLVPSMPIILALNCESPFLLSVEYSMFRMRTRDRLVEINLPDFTHFEVLQLLVERLSVAIVEPRVVDAIHERARGVPAAVVEILNSLLQSGHISVEGSSLVAKTDLTDLDVAVTEAERADVIRRYDALSPPAKFLVSVLSVAGDVVSVSLLRYLAVTAQQVIPQKMVTGMTANAVLGAPLDELVVDDLVEISEEEDTVTFVAEQVRYVVYRLLLHAHRQAIHKLVVDWYLTHTPEEALQPLLEDLGYHCVCSKQWDKATRLFAQAAASQRANGNAGGALDLLKICADLVEDHHLDHHLPLVLIMRGQCLIDQEQYALAVEELDHAIEVLPSRPGLVGRVCVPSFTRLGGTRWQKVKRSTDVSKRSFSRSRRHYSRGRREGARLPPTAAEVQQQHAMARSARALRQKAQRLVRSVEQLSKAIRVSNDSLELPKPKFSRYVETAPEPSSARFTLSRDPSARNTFGRISLGRSLGASLSRSSFGRSFGRATSQHGRSALAAAAAGAGAGASPAASGASAGRRPLGQLPEQRGEA